MRTEILAQSETLMAIHDGVERLVEAVGKTLGPNATSVVAIDAENQISYSSDGIEVGRSFKVQNKAEQFGIRIVREAVQEAHRLMADCSTTATVFTGSLLMEAAKLVSNRAPVRAVSSGIQTGLRNAVEALKGFAIDEVENKLLAIATTAARSDASCAEIALKAYKAAGPNGCIDVVAERVSELDDSRIQASLRYQGIVLPGEVVMRIGHIQPKNPFRVLMLDWTGRDIDETRFLDFMRASEEQTLLIFRDFTVRSSNSERTGLRRNLNKFLTDDIKLLVVELTDGGHGRAKLPAAKALQDFANFANTSTLFSSEQLVEDNLGRIEGIMVTDARLPHDSRYPDYDNLDDDVVMSVSRADPEQMAINIGDKLTILGAPSDPAQFDMYLHELIARMGPRRANPDEYRRRVAAVTNTHVLVELKGTGESSTDVRKGLIQNAISSIESALIGGVVPGGGAALAHASFAMAKALPASEADHAGYAAFREALLQPLNLIVASANKDPRAIQEQCREAGPQAGFDAIAERVTNFVEAEIFDPLANIICVLEKGTEAALQAISIGTMCLEHSDSQGDLPDDDDSMLRRSGRRRPQRPI